MSLQFNKMKSSSPKKDYGRLDDGQHLARIVNIIDYGLQAQTHWKTKTTKDPDGKVLPPQYKVNITFETPDEIITYEDKEGTEVTKPRWISKEYLLSDNEMSGLYKLKMALNPNMESLDELLNQPCMINVASTSGGNAKIDAVSKPMKGITVGELQNDTKYFDFDDPSKELFDQVIPWQQKKIKEALNFPDSPLAKMLETTAEY